MRQFHPQERRLYGVEARVHSQQVVVVLGLPAVHPQHPELLGQDIVVGRHQASVPEPAQVLRGEKAKTPDVAESPHGATPVMRTDRLRGVLDHPNPAPLRLVKPRGHVRRLAVEVDGDDRLRTRRDLLEHIRGVEVEAAQRDVGKNCLRPEPRDAARRREETVRRGDHLVPGADVERHQGQKQGVRTTRATDRVLRPAVGRHLLLKLHHFGAEDKLPVSQNRIEGCAQFGFDGLVLAAKIKERDIHRVIDF